MPAVSGRSSFRRRAWLPALLCALACVSARADELARVRSLQAAGQLDQALRDVRNLIEHRPNDPQYRLTEARILQQQHQDQQAIDVLSRLTEKYPELPEPYNNLAVLYAAQGRYELARQELQMALRANPAYATASANLGDVYRQLACRAYRQALQGDGDAAAQAHARGSLQALACDASPAVPSGKPAP